MTKSKNKTPSKLDLLAKYTIKSRIAEKTLKLKKKLYPKPINKNNCVNFVDKKMKIKLF